MTPADRPFENVYADDVRASSYADLDYPGTYYLAFRDLPELIERHVSGRAALDFGCGAGRSTRFLDDLGFDVVGVDIAERMLARARQRDPEGDYRLVPDGDLSALEGRRYDLILCAFTFDNIPGSERRAALFRALGDLLAEDGRMINLVSAPEIYRNEWASFSTKDFPENRVAESGDPVRIVMLDVDDRRPVQDVFWTEEDLRSQYDEAGLQVVEVHRPLGRPSEPYAWVRETEVSPWAIWVLCRAVILPDG